MSKNSYFSPNDLEKSESESLFLDVKKGLRKAFAMVASRNAVIVTGDRQGVAYCNISGIFEIPQNQVALLNVNEPFLLRRLCKTEDSCIARVKESPPTYIHIKETYFDKWIGMDPISMTNEPLYYVPLLDELILLNGQTVPLKKLPKALIEGEIETNRAMGIDNDGVGYSPDNAKFTWSDVRLTHDASQEKTTSDYWISRNKTEGLPDGGLGFKSDTVTFEWRNIRLLEQDTGNAAALDPLPAKPKPTDAIKTMLEDITSEVEQRAREKGLDIDRMNIPSNAIEFQDLCRRYWKHHYPQTSNPFEKGRDTFKDYYAGLCGFSRGKPTEEKKRFFRRLFPELYAG